MPFTIDFRDDRVLAWTAEDDGATVERIDDYAPTLRVQAHGDDASLAAARDLLAPDPRVVDLRVEEWRPGFRHDHEPTLAVDVDRVDCVTDVAHRLRERGPPGAYRCFDVDFSPQFRFCLERGVSPVPDADLTALALRAAPTELADPPLTAIEIDREPAGAAPAKREQRPEPAAGDERKEVSGSELRPETVAGDAAAASDGGAASQSDGAARRIEGSPADVATAVRDALRAVDPDVLVLSTAELVPVLADTAAEAGVALRLGRDPRACGAPGVEYPGWRRLARESTYESYGRVGHSPARYSVPGRAIVDRSNTFFYHEAGLPGCLDLVKRSQKPLQELAWASIGNVLTAMQIRRARREHDVLTPWNSWRHELPKRMDRLHAADRGGLTYAPAVGVHRRVHELDFQSLYPNVIRKYNVSPETVRCACHADRADVPELGYAICDRDGYLPDVLGPLIDARAEAKAELPDCEDPQRRARLEGRSSAIKWILVSCFGYQGFSNAKFGRIECHEAINAYARQILLDAKARLEAGGWRLVHGIVDSLWVTAREDATQEPLADLCAEITADANDIPLEYEGAFDWIAFVPRRDSEAGALTKYFGKRAGPDHPATDAAPADAIHVDDAADGEREAQEEPYKFRGVECRQRSTTTFVADAQRALIETVDRELSRARDERTRGAGGRSARDAGESARDPGEPACDPGGRTRGGERTSDGPSSDDEDRVAEAVCAALAPFLDRLEAGRVDARDLLVRTSTSKRADEYEQYTRTVAALERAEAAGLDPSPGQDVRFVVVDDDADSRERVRLDHEVTADADYDAGFYRERLLRAAESVLSPLGWRRPEIEAQVAERTDASLGGFS